MWPLLPQGLPQLMVPVCQANSQHLSPGPPSSVWQYTCTPKPSQPPTFAAFPGHNVNDHVQSQAVNVTFGNNTTEHEFLNPDLAVFFGGDVINAFAAQSSRNTANAQTVNTGSTEDTEPLPIGFQTLPDHPEEDAEPRRWGW